MTSAPWPTTRTTRSAKLLWRLLRLRLRDMPNILHQEPGRREPGEGLWDRMLQNTRLTHRLVGQPGIPYERGANHHNGMVFEEPEAQRDACEPINHAPQKENGADVHAGKKVGFGRPRTRKGRNSFGSRARCGRYHPPR